MPFGLGQLDQLDMSRASLEMARAGVEMARAMAPMAALQAAELARADVAMTMSGDVMVAASAELAREMASLNTTDMVELAARGQALASLAGETRSPALRGGYRTEAPAPWDAQDPADSLYRDARKALSGNSYSRAAELFKEIRQKYPKSSYASDAPYWEAFALQRQGGETNLRLAQDALGLQQRDYPRAATRGDAAALSARISGMLARRGDEQMATTIAGRAQRAADDGCPRAEEDERIEALNALSQMAPEQAMPILKKVLARREPCTQALRRTAVWMVARQKQPEAASLLVQAAKNDPDKEVREQAVFWLANVPTDEAVDMLIDLAKDGSDLELRKRAVYALSRSKSERAVTTLRDITQDNQAPEELRGEALNWYANRVASGADRLALLKDVYGKSQGIRFRQQVLSYIANTRSEESQAFLVNLAINSRDSLSLRRSAISYLASGIGARGWASSVSTTRGVSVVTNTQVGSGSSDQSANRPTSASVASALSQVYDRVEEIELRRQALSSLVSLRDNAGIDKLLDVAKNEKNPELRRSAVSYLSRTKDPRAIALLQDIINK
jgi:HEAT repeat protein/TolA-binding protein